MREIYETEIFPFKESPSGIPTNLTVLNLAFYPEERGPYNFDTYSSAYSSGLNSLGKLNNPRSRWGGIMREVLTSDFETANIQYIKFWVMDPFVENPEWRGRRSVHKPWKHFGRYSEGFQKEFREWSSRFG